MKTSETRVQFSCETQWEYLRNEWRRSSGKRLAYLANRYAWNTYPRKRKVAPFPLNVDIEVSSVCQIKCTHCFRQYMDIGENGFMPLDMYRSIVEECGRHGLFTLKFSMRGEPLLHPDIVEMVRLAKAAGVREVWINTNGGPITEDLARGIIGAGVDWITMSFDGLGANYEAVRVPLKYEDSLRKLKTLRRVRDELGAPTLLNVQGIWSAIKDDPQAYIRTMKGIVDRVAYNPDMHFDHNTVVPDPAFVCPRLWHRLCITSSGNYLKCPSDFTMREILGNVRETGVKQAWDVLQEHQRTLHLTGRRLESAVCAACHHGARKKKEAVQLDGERREDYTYESKEQG
ncbi:MAG: radical SAM protein [Desulfovibrio sp.]|jgi:radical SAM protein with 4Fe4S-binding SPASM domain|nr:radical SAM protein [Desulfovibrio sp.]